MKRFLLAVAVFLIVGVTVSPAWAHHKPWLWWLVYGSGLPRHFVLVDGRVQPFEKVMDCANLAEWRNAQEKTKLYRCILDSDHW